MSQTISPGADRPYGVQRVCAIWEQARSSFYHASRPVVPAVHKRRGPKPLISDADLLVLIRDDLATTPFIGEGHRKVWGRLRYRDGHRVTRKRVLRLMRENHLLSPHRGRPKAAKAHDQALYDLQTAEQSFQRELRRSEWQKTKPIREKVLGLIRRVAAQSGYDLVVLKDVAPFYRKDLDITDRIIQLYNQSLGPEKAPSRPAPRKQPPKKAPAKAPAAPTKPRK